MNRQVFQGQIICEGYSLSKGQIVLNNLLKIDDNLCDNPQAELLCLNQAIEKSLHQIQDIIQKKKSILKPEQLQIFESHLVMLEDPEYLDQIIEKIKTHKWSASKAVDFTTTEFSSMLASLSDPYLSERSHDIKDIGQRLLKNILETKQNIKTIDVLEGTLIFKEITPSMVAEMNLEKVTGIISEQSGTTSHAAILLKALDVPSLFDVQGLGDIDFENQPEILMNAQKGIIILNPSELDKSSFSDQKSQFLKAKAELDKLKILPAMTKDGISIQLYANISGLIDLKQFQKISPDGIGLFRTEFLFLDRGFAPTEEEQFQIYKSILTDLSGKKTIIRTLDIGGDKTIPYMQLPQEENPFLGLRGLRLCLKYQELFRTQLRALIRASAYGPLSIMFPMVTQLQEFIQAKKLFEEEKDKLITINENSTHQIKLGIMIEVPSAAIMAEDFAQHVDFFSIGTNDLIQYVCACDRLNKDVKYLYNSYEPAVLKLIYQVIQAANKHQKEVSLCGEMSSQLEIVPFLLGAGLKNLSMSLNRILKVKQLIRSLDTKQCALITTKILNANNANDVQDLLNQFS